MKKSITLLTVITLFIIMTTNATVWRVNNRPTVVADFTTLTSAVNAASANDTIYIEGSPTSYGGVSIQKALTIIGAGYWLDENDSTQFYKETSKVDNLYLYTSGIVIEGLDIDYSTTSATHAVYIATSNVTLKRNRIRAHATGSAASYKSRAVYIASNYNSITIEQNWIEATAANDIGLVAAIHFDKYPVNSVIRNNIIYSDTNNYAIFMDEDNPESSLVINNNTIWGDISTHNSAHYNNILIYGTYTEGTGELNANNLCNGTQYPNENGNQQNVVMTTVFEDYENHIDNGHLLKAGSPAIGAGLAAEDCGAFGTEDPYVLSGMPPIPTILDFEMTQAIGSPTIPVTLKAKSHK